MPLSIADPNSLRIFFLESIFVSDSNHVGEIKSVPFRSKFAGFRILIMLDKICLIHIELGLVLDGLAKIIIPKLGS